MRVYKDTPFEFGFLPWQVRPPAQALMVLVKATFDLVHDGVATIATEQALTTGPVHWDDEAENSLRFDSDFAVLKPRGECFFSGSAHSPGGEPTTSLLAGFRVGSIVRSIAVFGDRDWGALGAMTAPREFTAMPLRWERAFGGPGHAYNPVGTGLSSVERDGRRVTPLPNLEDPGQAITSSSDRPAPLCFAPLNPGWPERTRRAGTYDNRWRDTRWPWFPEDFDYGYYNSAPAAQQLREGYWRGDEEVGLQHLCAGRSKVLSKLPGLRARCFIERAGDPESFTEVTLVLDTVTVDGESLQAQCVWRGLIDNVDEKLEALATMFFIHESISEEHPVGYYREWLERKRAEEVQEERDFEPEAPEAGVEEVVPLELSTAEVLSGLAVQLRLDGPAVGEDGEPGDPGAHAAVIAQVEAMARGELDSPPVPQPSALRASMEAGGLEVPEALRELPDDLPERETGEDDTPEASALTREEVLRCRAYEQPLTNADLTEVDLSGVDFSGVDFSGAILIGAKLSGAVFKGAKFDAAVLSQADLTRADFAGASFREADLEGVNAVGVDAIGADFEGSTAQGSVWRGARLFKARLGEVDWVEADLTACDLRECVLDGGDFERAKFDRAHLEGASLCDTVLEGASLRECVLDGATMTNVRASEGADFTGASMRGVKGESARFERSVLEGVNAGKAGFAGASFSGARMTEVDLTGAVLKGAVFQEAVMVRAVLIKADAMEASFEAADLTDGDLRGANLCSAQVWRAKLGGAKTELAKLHRTLIDPENG